MAERTFEHADGRRWRIRLEGSRVHIGIDLPGDEPIERAKDHGHWEKARAEIEALVASQLADGFVETTAAAPAAPDLFASTLERWREADPSLDAAPLAAMSELDDATRARVRSAIAGLAYVWVDLGDGTKMVDMTTTDVSRAQAFEALAQVGDAVAVDRALVFAMRAAPFGLAKEAAELLVRRKPQGIAAELISCIRAIEPCSNDLPLLAEEVLEAMRPLDPEVVDALSGLAAHPRPETSRAACRVLAPLAADERIFDLVWAQRDRGELHEYPAMIACEARRDPKTIPWLERLAKQRRGRGWKARVDQAIERVRTAR